MMVSAEVDPAIRDDFDRWHRDEHLPRVLAIPGVVRGRRFSPPPGAPSYLAVYTFADDAAVRLAFASEEAGHARADWERWVESVRDLTVAVYAEIPVDRLINRGN